MTHRPPPLLEVEHLHHRYEGAADGRWAVQDASLVLHPGEVVAIVGESGSGKSTLLQCIAARLQPQAGQVRYRDAQGQLLDVHALAPTSASG
jgi:putative phosphonate transport system ATP-binding protein